jgi:para-nitrobenzyl esterase
MIVKTTKGRLEGITERGVNVFKGIPFAAPPVGDLRWQAPQEVAAWNDVRKADKFGRSCPQPVFPPIDGSEPIGKMSEDCLYLNVWTTHTELGPTIARPVMVWIHGGAYKIGDGISTVYDGSPLAKKGAVVVTFNYRLGHLGFFAHPALERENRGGPVNFGLLDQIAALTWVKDNIVQFGGDPGNVTIFGESAGAASVLALFASPMAEGLFHKGIAQSAYAIPEFSRGAATRLGAAVATKAWGLGENPTIKDLRNVPESAFGLILIPSESPHTKQARLPVPSLAPVAVYGDGVLPKKIRQTFSDGEQHKRPLMLGSNSDEQSVLTAFGIDAAAFLDQIERNAPEGTIPKWKEWYKQEHDPVELDDRTRFGGLLLRDILFTMQARWLATRHAEKSQVAYRYYFNYVHEQRRPEQPHGVPHGGEMVYPFNTGDISVGTKDTFTRQDRWMADRVSTYWFHFAQTGTPTAGTPGTDYEGLPWPRHEFRTVGSIPVLDDRIMKLGDSVAPHDSIVPQSNFRKSRLDDFALLYPTLEKIIEDQRG